MESERECEEAIKGLDGFQFEGNKLAVEKAKSSGLVQFVSFFFLLIFFRTRT